MITSGEAAAAMADVQYKCHEYRISPRIISYHHATRSKPVLSNLIMMLAALTGIVTVGGDPATDKVVLQAFKAGITNSAGLGWTASDPCLWKANQVICDNARNVVEIQVSNLSLTGTGTPELHKLSSLMAILNLSFNAFTGAMPTLAGMAKLTHASLNDNNFDSTPADFFDSTPADFFDGLTSIKEIWIDNSPLNRSSGGWSMPLTLKDAATTVTVLSMNNCNATGSIPSYLGSIPSYLGTMPALTALNVAYNSFSGLIPDSFQTSGIQTLLLNNQASNGPNGGVAFIGGMVWFQTLYLHGNSFTGPVPEAIAGFGGLSKIRSVRTTLCSDCRWQWETARWEVGGR